MPIQSDTTIQYILGAQKEEITFADTEIQNPYNTYVNAGLPPGPIGSPSLDAIKAVNRRIICILWPIRTGITALRVLMMNTCRRLKTSTARSKEGT